MRRELEDFCSKAAGYEVLAHMITVNTHTRDVGLVPRSRSEIQSEVRSSEKSIDRRLDDGHDELAILVKETGENYKQYDDMRRIYRIRPNRIGPGMLREIKMKGHIRPPQSDSDASHANVNGGDSTFHRLPEWEDFVRDFICK